MSKQTERAITYIILVLRGITAGLEDLKEINDCFCWALGPDWESIPISDWPKRVQKIGLDWPKDMSFEGMVDSIIEKWKEVKREKEHKRRFAHALLNLVGMEPPDDYAQAEAYYQKAAELLQEALGPDHPEVAMALMGLFLFYEAHQRYPQAEATAEKMLKILGRSKPKDPAAAEFFEEMASFYKKIGKKARAKELEERARWLRSEVPKGH